MKNRILFAFLVFFNCQIPKKALINPDLSQQFITVLGIAQDAGYPQPYCGKTVESQSFGVCTEGGGNL